MAAALDHQAQVILAGKIHSLGDVLSISSHDRVNARFGRPRIDPCQGLCEPRLIADVIWISDVLHETFGVSAFRISL